MGMGAADVVPGVSGGTIAFITGIYKELVESINSVSGALPLLLKGQLKDFWKAINGNFLLSVFAGIGISVFSLAAIMKGLLETHPCETWAFFLGLVTASSVVILRGVEGKWSALNFVQLIAGIALGAIICTLTPATTPSGLWFIFICGMLGICAMVLPGISGSFIMVILGKYEEVMTAVSSLDIAFLAVFACGAVVGLLSFCKLLSVLMKHCYRATVLVMAGFIIGSLVKIWPWTGPETVTVASILTCALGIALVAAVEIISKIMKK